MNNPLPGAASLKQQFAEAVFLFYTASASLRRWPLPEREGRSYEKPAPFA